MKAEAIYNALERRFRRFEQQLTQPQRLELDGLLDEAARELADPDLLTEKAEIMLDCPRRAANITDLTP